MNAFDWVLVAYGVLFSVGLWWGMKTAVKDPHDDEEA